jgi:hypothetical protein
MSISTWDLYVPIGIVVGQELEEEAFANAINTSNNMINYQQAELKRWQNSRMASWWL